MAQWTLRSGLNLFVCALIGATVYHCNNPNRPMCFVARKAAWKRLQEIADTDYEVVLLPTTEPIVLGETRYMNMYYIAQTVGAA